MAGMVVGTGVLVAGVAAARTAGRWARRRCDEALASAHQIPLPAERSFLFTVRVEGDRMSRAQARQGRALQQALDCERRDGAFLARRAAPFVPSDPA